MSALEKLQRVRDELIKAIHDRVDDSHDLSAVADYSGDLETLMDWGERLRCLNNLIGAMPQPEPTCVNPGACGSVIVTGYPTWEDFLDHVDNGNLEQAEDTLIDITRLPRGVAHQATRVYAAQLSLDQQLIGKARSLRANIAAKQSAMNLLHELFGVRGKVAVEMYEALKVAL